MARGKRASLARIVYFVIFVLAVVLLVFLIKNKWNVNAAIDDMLSLLRLK
ncbi:hypothetical protein HYU50_05460 [Candidatus Woesearchaeota archaeon]|nr:hypothetical protein [Candidatus Woesearchaeota archaeon]